jgi:hypothetical protein
MRTKLPLLGLVTAIVLIGAMAIGGPSFAGSGAPAKDTGPMGTLPWKSFSTGADGGTRVYVSVDGNIYWFFSPGDYQHVYIDGYILCYNGLSAVDTNLVMSGFGPSTQGTSNVLRSTSDGVLSLNQAFTFSAANKQLQIAMTVKNLTGSTVTNVVLRRFADFDIDGEGGDDYHATTADSYFAWGSHGMVLRHIAQPATVTRSAAVTTWNDFSCSPTVVAGLIYGDYAGTLAYNLGNLAAGKSKTVKVAYLRD